MVNWAGEEIDPRWPDYQQTLGAVIDCAYDEGLKVHFCVTGGGPDPVGAARIMFPVLQARREKLVLIEAVNEENASVDDAVAIVQILKPIGVPISCGLGNAGLDTINRANVRAGATVGILHEERSTDVARNIRQCWDFRLLDGAPACSEPQGPASSIAEETVGFNLAAARAARIICGAGYFCLHEGHGVFGRTYPYSANTPPGEPHSDTRFANLWEVPDNERLFAAARTAEQHLPEGCENWAKFNSNQPVTIQGGTASKLYGCIDGGRFCEIAIGTEDGTTFRAEQPCHLQISNPATAEILFDGQLTSGQIVGVPQLFAYVLVGTLG